MTKVFLQGGELLNVGEWDYQLFTEELVGNPWTGEGEAPEDWDFDIQHEIREGNPLPPGAIEADVEIATTAKGRLVLATDWYRLREDAYPPIRDQLDAYWKGGDAKAAMAEAVLAVKNAYPKP